MSHSIVIITNGNHFSNMILEKLLSQEAPRVAGILLVSGDYRGRTGLKIIWQLAREMTLPVFLYKIWHWSFFIFAQKLCPRIPLTVANAARLKGIPLFTSPTVNCDAARAWVASLQPSLIVSVSCPQWIGHKMIALAPRGGINIHFSLLPRYAGLMPTFWVLSRREKTTGISVHHMTERLDSGNLLRQETFAIQADDSVYSLFERLAKAAREILADGVDRALRGEAGTPQDLSQYTHFSHPAWSDYQRLRRSKHSLLRSFELWQSLRTQSNGVQNSSSVGLESGKQK